MQCGSSTGQWPHPLLPIRVFFAINSLGAHKQMWHVIYCDRETINFHKEGKKRPSLRFCGYLAVFWQWWWAYMAAQLHSQHLFSVLFRWRESSRCDWPARLKKPRQAAFMAAPALSPAFQPTRLNVSVIGRGDIRSSGVTCTRCHVLVAVAA